MLCGIARIGDRSSGRVDRIVGGLGIARGDTAGESLVDTMGTSTAVIVSPEIRNSHTLVGALPTA